MSTGQHASRRLRERGFSLIELMVAVAVVALLAAIATPTYRNYIRRGAVEEATSQLSTGQVALEQYFLDNRTYVGGPCPAATTNFTFACTRAAATYTITATGRNAVSDFVYTLDQADARTTAGPWGSGNCWVVRSGDSC